MPPHLLARRRFRECGNVVYSNVIKDEAGEQHLGLGEGLDWAGQRAAVLCSATVGSGAAAKDSKARSSVPVSSSEAAGGCASGAAPGRAAAGAAD